MPDIKPMAAPGRPQPLMPIVVVAAILSLGVGGYVGYSLGVRSSDAQFKAGHAAGWDEAKKKVASTGIFAAGLAMTTLSGTIEEIKSDSLIVRVPQLVRNPLAEPAPLLRTIVIGKDTKIVATVPKSPAEQQKQMDDYNEAQKKFSDALMSGQKNVTPPPTPPAPYSEKELKLSEIEKGASVVVQSADDVTSAESIVAVSIRIQSNMLVPTMPSPAAP